MKGKSILALLAVVLICFSCNNTETPPPSDDGTDVIDVKPKLTVPDFNADSAYAYIDQQVAFGPRVPESEAHTACLEWMEAFFKAHADEVIIQRGEVFNFKGEKMTAKNVIASFQPENNERVLLCAHWDTRPYADWDADESKHDEPILGANDGGSGVGVLMEIARILKDNPTHVGIDIILFDIEDYGQPADSDRPRMDHSYCLGSQYWGKNPHKAKYEARFGILLDMVGAIGTEFPREGYSMEYAPDVVDKVWNAAAQLGYRNLFTDREGGPITDDHLYVNKLRNIPTIDIIQRDPGTRTGFGHYWHTHKDNMEVIDKTTLKKVGQTVLKVLYEED